MFITDTLATILGISVTIGLFYINLLDRKINSKISKSTCSECKENIHDKLNLIQKYSSERFDRIENKLDRIIES